MATKAKQAKKAKRSTAQIMDEINNHLDEPKTTARPPGKPKNGQALINLSKRQVNVTNLNFSPERNGEDKVARIDLSMEVLLEADDIPQFLMGDRAADMVDGAIISELWDEEGTPRLPGVSDIRLCTKVAGYARIGSAKGKAKDMIEFKNGVLKKCILELMLAHKAKLRCQVRVDPTGYLNEIEQMVIAETAQFAFTGEALPPEGDDGQGELAV